MADIKRDYTPTEAQRKGGARVYIAGDVTDCKVGDFRKKSGRMAHGVCVEYDQTRRR